MHQLIFWGCLLAVAITFPLVFGWIHFTSAPDDQMTYVTHLFGYPAGSFRLHTVTALVLFHGLDIAAFLVLGGIALVVVAPHARRRCTRSADTSPWTSGR